MSYRRQLNHITPDRLPFGRVHTGSIPDLRVIIPIKPAALAVSIAKTTLPNAPILTARAAELFTDPFEKVAATAAAIPDLGLGVLPIVTIVSAFHD
jgi:hypothetical protein